VWLLNGTTYLRTGFKAFRGKTEKLFQQTIHIRIDFKDFTWKIKGNYFNKQHRSPLKICQNNFHIEMFQQTVAVLRSSEGAYSLHVQSTVTQSKKQEYAFHSSKFLETRKLAC
jgi:hypothetical protein